MMANRLLELYIHIPFCVKKCLYCDFLSASASEAEREAYMEALFLEIRERAVECKEYQVCSIFIGGGTPSVLSGERIEQMLSLIGENYALTEDAEITIEVNPGTVDGEKLRIYRRAGVNRLSIGLQSAIDEELRSLGRIHTWQQFLETYQQARAAGFENLNVDLMSALPGQTRESYAESLRRVLDLRPEHISAYSLIVEEGTPFYRAYEKGQLALPDEDTEREMYRDTERMLLEQEYHRYEISNYALPGKECRHNIGYWTRREYLGFGLGAASLMDNTRFHNGTDRQAYVQAPLEQRQELQQLTVQEQMEETLYLGLRMTRGISSQAFQQRFGVSLEKVYGPVIEKNSRDGLLIYRTYEEADDVPDQGCAGIQYLTLTKLGLDLSNYVMAQFLLE